MCFCIMKITYICWNVFLFVFDPSCSRQTCNCCCGQRSWAVWQKTGRYCPWTFVRRFTCPNRFWLMIAYMALFSSLLSRLTALAHGSTWTTSFFIFYSAFFWISTTVAYLQLVPHETAAILVQVLCTPYNHAPCHFMQSHTRKVYLCLAVTCHLHFWQNDLDLLCATVVSWRWNGYWNKCWSA